MNKKKEINAIYRKELAGLDHLRFQRECDNGSSSCWFTCVMIDKKIDIASIQKHLKKDSIPTRRIFMPITLFPPYKRYGKGAFPRSCEVYDRGLALPSSLLNSSETTRFVARKLKGLVD